MPMPLAPEIVDLMHRAEGFLFDAEMLASGQGGAALIRARFALDRFSPALFDRLGIPCPTTLVRAAEKRRAEFLAGRAMARAALKTLALPAVEIAIGPDRAPIWPQGVLGSISHARGHCAAIVAPEASPRSQGLGIDIEAYAAPRAQAALVKIALSNTERALLDGKSGFPPDRLATLIFSAKETLFKALYPVVRAHFGFDAAVLSELPAPDHLTLRLTRSLHPTLREGAAFNLRYVLNEDHLVTWMIAPPQITGA